jgi:hypothetical protein
MKSILLTWMFFTAFGALAWGDAIPYPDVGTVAPTVTITATATGDVIGYFYGASAGDTDEVKVCDTTVGPLDCSPLEFDNQTTAPGASFTFAVTAGDTLVFDLENFSTSTLLSSDPSMSADGLNHAYVTPYSGTGGPAGIPAGTFVGMEDLASFQGSDFDYNDDQFVFTNLTVTPEPSMLILCAGLLALLPVARRKSGF